MVRVFLNVGYYIFTDVSLNPSNTIYTGDFYNVGSDCFDGGTWEILYSPRDGSLADAFPSRAGRASSQVSEGQRSLIGPLYSALMTRGTSCLACLVHTIQIALGKWV